MDLRLNEEELEPFLSSVPFALLSFYSFIRSKGSRLIIHQGRDSSRCCGSSMLALSRATARFYMILVFRILRRVQDHRNSFCETICFFSRISELVSFFFSIRILLKQKIYVNVAREYIDIFEKYDFNENFCAERITKIIQNYLYFKKTSQNDIKS